MTIDYNGMRYRPSVGGHVESYFLKLNGPDQRRALWLKATILARVGGNGTVAEAWAIAFDRDREPVGVKQVVPYDEARFDACGLDVKVAELRLREGSVAGRVLSGEHEIAFDLRFTTDQPALVPLFHPKMYQGRLPSSKFVTPHPDARFDGHYELDGRRIEVAGWSGMQGHNWGRGHAEQYGWAHCNQWDGGEPLLLEAVTARVRVGRVLLPAITVACVRHRGVQYDFNRPLSLLRGRGEVSARRYSFTAKSKLASVQAELAAEADELAGLYYENPDGAMTHCLNSKIARGRLRLIVAGRPPLDLTTRSAALEIGTRRTDHGVRMLV